MPQGNVHVINATSNIINVSIAEKTGDKFGVSSSHLNLPVQ